MRVAAALAVISLATGAQAHSVHSASPGCTAFAMASTAHSDYLSHKLGSGLSALEQPGAYVMWKAWKADQTRGEDWCWAQVADIFEDK